jgi:hypothetical protein
MPKTKTRTILIWSLAVIITLGAVIYQRVTGPTYPLRGEALFGGMTIHYTMPRSCDTNVDALVEIPVPGLDYSATMIWRRYKSDDSWNHQDLALRDGKLVAIIPRQPPAGKVEYQITITDPQRNPIRLTRYPVLIRFKGSVPAAVLVPHILFMFVAMLLGTRAGVGAVFREDRKLWFTLWTTILLFAGGLILGPIVQKYAFGSYWTGWPFGHDLTDNKTAVAMLFWIIAIWRFGKNNNPRGWIIAAAVIQLLVYSIPHSVWGSELDLREKQAAVVPSTVDAVDFHSII